MRLVPGLLLACALLQPACRTEGVGPPDADPVQAVANPTADAEAAPEPPPAPPEECLGVADVGVFSDLDEQVQLRVPEGTDRSTARVLVDRAHDLALLYLDGWPAKVYPLDGGEVLEVGHVTLSLRPGDHAELAPLVDPDRVVELAAGATAPPGDRDRDGVPDPLDFLIGGYKTVLNGARYENGYISLRYPGGDLPREKGVCTDVIIRALRNAGVDLQVEVSRDIARRPRAYRMVKKRDRNIDHRRIRTILPYFKRHWDRHAKQLDDPSDPLRPGDVVFMDTLPKSGPDHIGIISDRTSDEGLPLVINNWTDGYSTSEMDLLSFVPVTHRFRLPATVRDRGPISGFVSQLVVVVSEGWDRSGARLHRFARRANGRWQSVGRPVSAVLGHGGYGWGRGIHGDGAPAGRAGPIKREGDARSPAGVFGLGTLYGYASAAPEGVDLAYQAVDEKWRCVDDSRSRHYNRVVDQRHVEADWSSSENMRRSDDLYRWTLAIEHNAERTQAEAGSCIFLHVWAGPDQPMTGCTAIGRTELETLTSWLEPNAAALVALPRSEYKSVRRAWGLPRL